MQKTPKILIVRLSAIGDVVQSTVILKPLKKLFPDSSICWAVEDISAELIIGNPLIDKVFVLPKRKWKKRGFSLKNLKEYVAIVKEIRKEQFDIAIDLQELFKSGSLMFLSGAKRRIAHKGTRELAHLFSNEKLPAHDIFDPNKRIIERYLEPAEYLGAEIDEISFSMPVVPKEVQDKVDGLLSGIKKGKPVIVFSPSTVWPSKHWVESYWSEVFERLYRENNIIFVGSDKDSGLISRITGDTDKTLFANSAGKTGLLELFEIMRKADIVIAPDTGPMHIANAAEKPVIISIFGSTSNKRTPPVGNKHIALSAGLSCQPCFKRNCPRKDFPDECMHKITPELLLRVVDERLSLIKKNVII
jgi:lipopolysaccharide heptosyltransferase II